jgi:hypothetical protein
MPPVESYEGRDAGDVKDHPLDRCGHEIDGDEDRPRRGEGREVVCVDPRARPKDFDRPVAGDGADAGLGAATSS